MTRLQVKEDFSLWEATQFLVKLIRETPFNPCEFTYVLGYWEWVKDVLFHFQKMLIEVQIIDVFASLYIYDWNKDVI